MIGADSINKTVTMKLRHKLCRHETKSTQANDPAEEKKRISRRSAELLFSEKTKEGAETAASPSHPATVPNAGRRLM